MDQIADIGMARMDRQLVAFFDDLAHGIDVGKVQLRIDTLAVHVQRYGHQIDIAGALAVAEQAALDAIRTGHQAQFGGSNARAAVVVGVQANQHAVALVDLAAKIFDLVGIDIRSGGLNGGRQVEDQLLLRRRLEYVDHRVADLDGEVGLSGAEHLGRIFEAPIGFRRRIGETLDHLRRGDGDVHHTSLVLVEHDAAEARCRRVVVMDDGPLGTLERFEGAGDQVLASLGQHLNGDVIRNMPTLDQLANEIEIGLRCRGKAHFDLLQADLHQRLEETHLLRRVHRLDQRLVAIAQIGAQPDRSLSDGLRWPGTVRQIDHRKRAIFV